MPMPKQTRFNKTIQPNSKEELKNTNTTPNQPQPNEKPVPNVHVTISSLTTAKLSPESPKNTLIQIYGSKEESLQLFLSKKWSEDV